MSSLQNITELISAGNLDEALTEVNGFIASTPDSDEALYMRGRIHWRRGEMRLAINDYNAAVALNPESPARLALESANNVLDFYNRDLYNP